MEGARTRRSQKSCWRIIKFIGLSFLLTILNRMGLLNVDTMQSSILCRNTAVRNLKTGSNICRLHYGRIASQHEEARDIQHLNCCMATIVCYLSNCLCHHGEQWTGKEKLWIEKASLLQECGNWISETCKKSAHR